MAVRQSGGYNAFSPSAFQGLGATVQGGATTAAQGVVAVGGSLDQFRAFSGHAVGAVSGAVGSLWSDLHDLLARLEGSAAQNPAVQSAPVAPASTAPTPAVSTPAGPGGSYTVQPGDSLWAIAARVLGDGQRWPEIYDLNQGVIGSNPDLILPGQVLQLPAGAASPAPWAPPAPATPSALNPNSFFMTQFVSKWNPDGPSSSLNCGPTSLAMALKAFGKAPPGGNPQDPEQFIEKTRLAMTGSTADTLTTCAQVLHGAQASGLSASYVHGTSGVDGALASGKMVVACGDPIAYEGDLNGSTYGNDARFNGGHFILVVASQGDRYVVDDPLSRVGSFTISRSQLASYLAYQGWNTGVAVGA